MEFLAKLGEPKGCKFGIWDIVPVKQCFDTTGRKPVGVRWVDTDKSSDPNLPDIRCRLVVQETNRVTTLDLSQNPGAAFASTVPMEVIRIQLSMFMSRPAPKLSQTHDDDWVIIMVDISRAHPHAEVQRELFTTLPDEHPASGDPLQCGLLRMNLYGAKDAGKNFENLVCDISVDFGGSRGLANPCVFRHSEKDLSWLHYGDDFMISGKRKFAYEFVTHLKIRLIVKVRGVFGPRASDTPSITMLHRQLCYDRSKDIFTISADPKHVRLLRAVLGFNDKTRGVVTPGLKIPVTPENSRLLDSNDTVDFRSACMRLGFLAQDRPDCQYPSKEAARGMSSPTVRHWEILKRCVRYLISHPECQYVFVRQHWPRELTMYSDTDWAGCPLTRRSTSGTMAFLAKHLGYSQSSTQIPISTSSGEAEFYGCVKCASRGLGLRQNCTDLGLTLISGLPINLRLYTDSSSAMGTASKRGMGKIRHLEIGSLWLQQAVNDRKLVISKIDGKKNPPDILTKFVDNATLLRMLKLAGLFIVVP
jgi:hypothetical protein